MHNKDDNLCEVSTLHFDGGGTRTIDDTFICWFERLGDVARLSQWDKRPLRGDCEILTFALTKVWDIVEKLLTSKTVVRPSVHP